MILKRWGARLLDDNGAIGVDGKGDERWEWRNYWTRAGAELEMERMMDRDQRLFPSSQRVRWGIIDRKSPARE